MENEILIKFNIEDLKVLIRDKLNIDERNIDDFLFNIIENRYRNKNVSFSIDLPRKESNKQSVKFPAQLKYTDIIDDYEDNEDTEAELILNIIPLTTYNKAIKNFYDLRLVDYLSYVSDDMYISIDVEKSNVINNTLAFKLSKEDGIKYSVSEFSEKIPVSYYSLSFKINDFPAFNGLTLSKAMDVSHLINSKNSEKEFNIRAFVEALDEFISSGKQALFIYEEEPEGEPAKRVREAIGSPDVFPISKMKYTMYYIPPKWDDDTREYIPNLYFEFRIDIPTNTSTKLLDKLKVFYDADITELVMDTSLAVSVSTNRYIINELVIRYTDKWKGRKTERNTYNLLEWKVNI